MHVECAKTAVDPVNIMALLPTQRCVKSSGAQDRSVPSDGGVNSWELALMTS